MVKTGQRLWLKSGVDRLDFDTFVHHKGQGDRGRHRGRYRNRHLRQGGPMRLLLLLLNWSLRLKRLT